MQQLKVSSVLVQNKKAFFVAFKNKTSAKASNDKVVGRLTDTSKYTGAHKERFDESGKGKGADGKLRHAGVSKASASQLLGLRIETR